MVLNKRTNQQDAYQLYSCHILGQLKLCAAPVHLHLLDISKRPETRNHLMLSLSSIIKPIIATALLVTFTLHCCLQRIINKKTNYFSGIKLRGILSATGLLTEIFIQI